jgi:uncharacterized protein YkwD
MSGGTFVGPPPASRGFIAAQAGPDAKPNLPRCLLRLGHRLDAAAGTAQRPHSPGKMIGDDAMRSSHSTVLCRSIACGAALTAFGLAGSPAAHADTSVAKGQCPSVDVTATAGNGDAIRASILCLTNADRANHHRQPLRESSELRSAAVEHSSDMVRESYFAHTTLGGATFVDRIVHARYITRHDTWALGENLAWGTGDLGTPRGIENAWMHSAGHRANILKGAYRDVGIGVTLGTPTDHGHGATFTIDFGARR